MSERLTVDNLNDQVYSRLREEIVTQQLKAGCRLVDLQIAERYGISRTPVRDAMRKLAKEGLIVSHGKRGYYVFKATKQDIIEIFELRLIYDKAVVDKIITEQMPGNYQGIMNKILDIENYLKAGIQRGPKAFIEYDEGFHDSIIKLSNNSRLIAAYAENRTQTKGFRSATSFSSERIDKANKLHFELLGALKNMDREKALQAVAQHVALSRTDALTDEDREEKREGEKK